MQLRGQAARGIDQHHILLARLARGHGVEAHGCGVAALLAHDFNGIARGPDAQLLACGCAVGVGRGQQHACAFIGQVLGELAYGRGLARAVDARDHDHGGCELADDQGLLERLQQVGKRLRKQLLDGRGLGGLGFLDAALEVGEQMLRCLDAGIGHQQRIFELFVQRFVDLGAREHR